jgi:hypothetical protein
MSHDWEAVRALERAGEPVAIPVLGLWGVFAVAFDDGAVNADDGKRAIDDLQHESEFVPKGLARLNLEEFGRAIAQFNSRLRCPRTGATPSSPRRPQETLYLYPRQ